MEQRSPGGVPEEWRQQGLSGQPLCRSAMGAASRGDGFLFFDFMNEASETPARPVKALASHHLQTDVAQRSMRRWAKQILP